MKTIPPIEDADVAAHNAAWAIPALLSDEDLRGAWRAHWRAYETWSDAGEWFDRHRELMAEITIRGLALFARNR